MVAGVLSFLVAAGSGLSIAAIRYSDRQITRIRSGPNPGCQGSECGLVDVTPQCEDKACNFLILGSDSRAGLTKGQQEKYGNTTTVKSQRADTIIVVHVDAARDRTTVIHIPRDLRVEIPGFGTNKINSAFEHGPNVMVQTVEKLTKLQINHYISVNFAGFQGIVNALGGVPICIQKPMIDTLSGLYLRHPGCYNLTGGQALAFVRARHVQGDTIPDFSRISRQQQFMRVVIQKMSSPTAITKLRQLIDATKDNLVVDDNLNLYALQDLTRKLAEVGQAGVTFRVVPAVPVLIDDISYVEAVQPAANKLFYRIRKGQYLGSLGKEEPGTPISPANITVQVMDAGNAQGAQDVASFLRRAGFVVRAIQASPADLTRSNILYAKGAGKQEAVVSSYLPLVPPLYDETHAIDGVDVIVAVGQDFKGIEPS